MRDIDPASLAVGYLITGPTGAGKTTVAMELAKEIPAIRFSVDEWMRDLFRVDPQPEGHALLEWALQRLERCETVIGALCHQHFDLGHPVILDLGLMKLDHRNTVRRWVVDAGGRPHTHVIDAPAHVRRDRVRTRNNGASATYSITVSDAMFDFAEDWYEPVTAAELIAERALFRE